MRFDLLKEKSKIKKKETTWEFGDHFMTFFFENKLQSIITKDH